MKKKLVIGTLVISSLVQSAPAMAGNNEVVGGVLGGVIGGLLGSQVGGGSGQKWATGIGAIAGALIGAEVARGMDQYDQQAYQNTQRECLNGQLGEERSWRGQRSGARGSFKTVREGYNSRGEYCREYVSVVQTRAGREERKGIACSGRNGSWSEEQNTQSVRWGGRDDRRDDRDDRRDDRWDGRGRGPGHGGPRPGPMPPPPPSSHRDESDSVYVSNITRRGGGEWVRISLRDAMNLSRVEVEVTSRQARVLIRDAYVITDRGQRVQLRRLVDNYALSEGQRAQADVNGRERIQAVDILVESMGGSGEISVEVSSRDGRPRIRAERY